MRRTTPTLIFAGGLAVALILSNTTTASAQDASEVTPAVFHRAPVAWEAGQSASLNASVEGDWTFERLEVMVRPLDSDAAFEAIAFSRSPDNTFVAVIPGERMQPPGVEYFIASTDKDGARRTHFGSEAAPHPVVATGETAQTREAARLARHRGNRSSFELRGQYTLYGQRLTADALETDPNSDQYWVTEAEYTWRRLSTLYDIFFGIGFMRGEHATVPTEGGPSMPVGVDASADAPGLNWGYGGVTLELHRNFSASAKLMLGASAEGFAAGVGGLIRIGRIAGTRLELGAEAMMDAGSKGLIRFAWDTVPRVPMALTLEVDGWPDSSVNPSGTRLYYQAGVRITDGFTVIGQVGRATRSDAVEGGFMGGVVTRYEF